MMRTREPSTMRVTQQWKARLAWALGALAILVGLLAAISLIPVKYVIQSPGPTVDVLGSQGDVSVLEFSGSGEEYGLQPRSPSDEDGQLRMVTVSSVGGPGTTVRIGDVVRSWLRPGTAIRRFSDLYGPETTADDVAEAGRVQMESSHSAAAIAAMDYLGIPMDTTMTVVGTVEGSGAAGKLLDGDELISLQTPDGVVHEVTSPSVPFVVMERTEPGSVVKVTVDRDGKREDVEVVTAGPPDSESLEETPSGSRMGVYLTADTEMPLDVSIHLERIGGPSAGLVFALGIVDRLTPEGITGGEVIAATGALDFAGNVIPIGGVVQKMFGAQRDGAKWFLLPKQNCSEAVGNVPAGMHAVPVSTLRQGVHVVEAIADGNTKGLPECAALPLD